MPLGIGCFKEAQYDELLKVSSDAENMNPTWEEWLKSKEKTKQELETQGKECVDVEVDLFELMNYCQKEGLQINGGSRAQYVQHLLSRGLY